MKTRYRIIFDGVRYKIQFQHFRFTLFCHWKRIWVDITKSYYYHVEESVPYFKTLEEARSNVNRLKRCDIKDRRDRKERVIIAKKQWNKVWP